MKWKSKDVIGLRAIYHFNKGQWIVDRRQDQEKGGWASKGSKLWEGKCMTKANGRQVLFSKATKVSVV